MDWVANIIVAVGAVSFLALGGSMAWGGDKTASASAVLTVACFLVLLLLISKFKHVKGFGFEGEMWDQEQVKAAELRKNLSDISESLSQQVAVLAARLGYWDSALSLEELMEVIDQNSKWLATIGRGKERQDEILSPIYRKVEQYYWNAARELVNRAFSDQRTAIQDRIGGTPAERVALQRRLEEIDAASTQMATFTLEKFHETRRLTFLLDLLTQNRALLPGGETYMRRLTDLNGDLIFFVQNRRSRPH